MKTDCNVKCDKNQEITLGGSYLTKQDEPYCSLDLAFTKIKLEYNESLPETENQLETNFRWMDLLKNHKETLNHENSVETVEKVSYILTDFQPDFLSLVDFWSATENDQSFEESWEDQSSSMLNRLTQTEDAATRLCASLSWRYSSDCKQKVKRNCDQFRTFLTHMNETRHMQIRFGSTEPISEEGRRLLAEKQEFIETQMNKMRLDLDDKLKRNFDTKIERLYETMFHRVTGEKYLRSACTLFEYMNGGEKPSICQDVNGNSYPTFAIIDFSEELCAYREVKKRSVVVPAVFPRDGEKVEEGVINLKELFGLKDVDDSRDGEGSSSGDVGDSSSSGDEGDSSNGGLDSRRIDWDLLINASHVGGETIFKIPNMEWLLKHDWISEEEKKKGPFFLREFVILPLAVLDYGYNHDAR